MTAPLRPLILALALLACGSPVDAAVFRVDDSGTVVGQPITKMRWRQLAPGRSADNTVEGRVTVVLQLNLSNWVNRPARIYMALAPTQGEQLVARWRTQGRLLPGQVSGGMRTLVYEGVVRDAFLRETIVMDLSADGRQLEHPQSLQFHFEIEVNP